MTNRSLDLNDAMRFEKDNNFCSHKIRAIIIKNVQKKTKDWNQEVWSKIMNCFLIYRFIISYPYKSQEIINHHQNTTLASHFIKKPNRANPVNLNYSLRRNIEDWPKVGTNPLLSVKLVGLTNLTIFLHINSLSWPILLAS